MGSSNQNLMSGLVNYNVGVSWFLQGRKQLKFRIKSDIPPDRLGAKEKFMKS